MDFRKADTNDVELLVLYRKQQLIDEGASPDTDIDKKLSEYFIANMVDGSLVLWLAVDAEEIVATSGVCFYQLPPTYSNPTGSIAYITNMYTFLNEVQKCFICKFSHAFFV